MTSNTTVPPGPLPSASGTEASRSFDALFSHRPVVLAPMEDVSDAAFRRLVRGVGAELCVTEFVNVDTLLVGEPRARRKIELLPEDRPTAIQIYGSDPESLEEAARIAEAAGPAYVDLNCGCWIPRIARRGAGAGWLKRPDAMVAMARRVVGAVSLPVTVKTRIGIGDEGQMPIVDLARRLEDVGVRALALHCRTAQMGYEGVADWTWAARVQAAVRIPVLVNGDLRTAVDVKRALDETGCAGAMVGRAALQHPWIFREARALLDRGETLAPPTISERLDFCRRQLLENVAQRGQGNGVQVIRRHLVGYFGHLEGGALLRQKLNRCDSLEGCLGLLDEAAGYLRERPAWAQAAAHPAASVVPALAQLSPSAS